MIPKIQVNTSNPTAIPPPITMGVVSVALDLCDRASTNVTFLKIIEKIMTKISSILIHKQRIVENKVVCNA